MTRAGIPARWDTSASRHSRSTRSAGSVFRARTGRSGSDDRRGTTASGPRGAFSVNIGSASGTVASRHGCRADSDDRHDCGPLHDGRITRVARSSGVLNDRFKPEFLRRYAGRGGNQQRQPVRRRRSRWSGIRTQNAAKSMRGRSKPSPGACGDRGRTARVARGSGRSDDGSCLHEGHLRLVDEAKRRKQP